MGDTLEASYLTLELQYKYYRSISRVGAGSEAVISTPLIKVIASKKGLE